ncbi:LGFP repeat-containing protein [Kineococcus xinjiangensis]|uniref:LGFP repeat-containing protein n=1 Tax=Kineococcus xinjiangensis TaxID=512762 RepID=A0A2S6ICI4_9ACTN|nr:CAP domain-containing protein [Kineococcus xinjiangensis]PPK90897.1 LGFP repeat-containing protein [Kineococcus xinjiangensis]
MAKTRARRAALTAAAAALLSLLGAGAVSPAPAEAGTGQAQVASTAWDGVSGIDVSGADLGALRQGTLTELNTYRRSLGLGTLVRNGGLDAKAQGWADTMARTGRFVHNPDLGYPAGLGGNSEIILKAGTDNGSPAVAVRSWIGSAPHQRVMVIREMTLAGIGVARIGRDVYYVVNFGYPVAPPAPASMEFRRGTRTLTVGGAILDTYRTQGLDRSAIGWPATNEFGVHGGRGQHFDAGSIYWNAAAGAHPVRGLIRERWASMSWEAGWLGYPTGAESGVRGGALQRFQGGLVYWSPGTGAQAVRGAILDAYGRTGFENGRLGYPVSSEQGLRGGAFAHFQGGSVYWSSAHGAHAVVGAIREAWARQGWEAGRLGYPRSGEYPVAGGVRQDFAGGSATYAFGTGAVAVTHR